MNLLISFRSELLKTRRTATIYFTILVAAFIPVVYLVNMLMGDELNTKGPGAFDAFMFQGAAVLSVGIFPLFIVLACTMLPQIEFRNNTWKQVFASPQPVENVFFARYLNIQVLIIIFMILYNVFMLLAAVAAHFITPDAGLLNYSPDWMKLLMINVNCYIAVLSMSAIHFWLGLRFRNFLVPIAIGFVLWFTGGLMVMDFKTPNTEFYPYAHLILSTFPEFKHLVPKVQLISVAYMLVFLGIGYMSFKRKIK